MKISDYLIKNNNNLDIIRLLLASMVVYGHAPCFIDSTGYSDFFGGILHFTYSGNIAVITFFMISGLLVSNSLFSKKNWKVYLLSRVFRLLPGLIFLSVCTVIICGWFSEKNPLEYIQGGVTYICKNAMLNIQYVISDVSFLRDNHPMNGKYANTVNGSLWTIPLEFKMYLLMLGIWFISRDIKNDFIIPICLCIGIFYPLMVKESVLGSPETLYMIPAFFLGSLLSYYKDRICLNIYFPITLIMISYLIKHEAFSHWCLMLGMTLFFVWLAGCRCVRKYRLPHDISYGVYLWGWPIEQLVGYFMPWLNYYVFILISLACTFFVAYISCVFVEEPSLKCGKKICQYISNGD